MTDHDLPLRQAVRALMIDHHDRVLLIKLDLGQMPDPFSQWVGWVLPGGGIEGDEEPAEALRRELLEETGLAQAFVGPVVCLRTQRGAASAAYSGQHETIYLVPCHDFALAPTMSPDELRDEGVIDMRWFTLDELRAVTDNVVPEGLVELITRVLEYGGSVEPLVIEVHHEA